MSSDKKFAKGRPQSPSKKSSFSNSKRADLITSGVIASLMFVPYLSIVLFFLPLDCYLMNRVEEYDIDRVVDYMITFILFPVDSMLVIALFDVYTIGKLIVILFIIFAFMSKLIIFYLLARITRIILGQKVNFWIYHSPSVLVFIISIVSFAYYIWWYFLICRRVF